GHGAGRGRHDALLADRWRTHPLRRRTHALRRRTHAFRPAQLARRRIRRTALLELGELPLDAVQMQVDLPLVVPAEADPEDDVVDLLGADWRACRVAGERRLHAVEERVDLVDLVSPAQRPTAEPLTLTRHLSHLRRSKLSARTVDLATAGVSHRSRYPQGPEPPDELPLDRFRA